MIGIGDPAQVSWALLTISACIGLSSMISGRIITRTGRTMILPSIGSTCTTIMFVYLATQAGRQTFDQFLVWAGITAIFMGTVMGVVQVTIQTAAGRRMLGAASGSSVRAQRRRILRRGAVRRRALRDSGGQRANGWRAVRADPSERAGLCRSARPAGNAALNAVVARGFSNAFLSLAFFTAIGSLLAWINPQRRV